MRGLCKWTGMLLVIGALVACAGEPGGSTTTARTTVAEATTADAPDGATEEALETRFHEYAGAFSEKRWVKLYQLHSPEARELCSTSDFVEDMAENMAAFFLFFGDTELEFVLEEVEVDGTLGWTPAHVLIDGVPGEEIFGEDDDAEESDARPNWVFTDGQWWFEPYWDAEGCPGAETETEPTGEPKPTPTTVLDQHALGAPLAVPASVLDDGYGDTPLTGEVTVTFLEHEVSQGIDDQFITSNGTIAPRGTFLIVYYSVANDLNVEMQPATQIADDLYITDAQGRRWESVDYTADYGNMSGSAAVAKGYRQPAEKVPPGFENTTAIVFDLPQNATDGLALVWEDAGVKVGLQ